MTQQAPTIHQTSEWDPNASFTITGRDLQTIADVASLFRPLVYLANNLLKQGQTEGKIKDVFYDDRGNPINPDQLEGLLKQITDPFSAPSVLPTGH